MTASPSIRPVIMSGGAGSRLWPLSRRARPKQFHRLLSERSLFQQTLSRFVKREGFLEPVILGAAGQAALIRADLDELGLASATALLEPCVRNTAPAIAALSHWALTADDSGDGAPPLLLVLPADHVIDDADGFAEAVRAAAPRAVAGDIVTFGVRPTRPETGYGYIKAGELLSASVFRVASFEEKPPVETARKYMSSGEYFWNAGVFLFSAATMSAELARHCPLINDAAQRAVAAAVREDGVVRLDADAFAASPEESIDYAVMEKTDRAAVAPITIGWSDIGSWDAVLAARDDTDSDGNCLGDTIHLDCKNTLAISDGPQIAAIGLEDIIVVAAGDSVLVARRDRAQDVKKVVAALKAVGKSDLL
ncbi:MAG: mannose-1-phosphate guanylyltransferase/mannose-6-phosphate isomerase [Pseudomonadota bacterium]